MNGRGLVAVLLLAGCTAMQSANVQAVVESVAADVAGCKQLGLVHGWSGQQGIAENEVLQKAAAIGASHIVWQHVTGGLGFPSAAALAYRCPRTTSAASAAAESVLSTSQPENSRTR